MRLWSPCTALLLVSLGASQAAAETLEQAWADAYQANPSLQAERANLRATDELVSQALSHWRPSVDATANVGKTYQNTPGEQIFGTSHFSDTTHGYGLQVTQPVFRGFRTRAETEAAEKQVLAERAKLQHAEQQLFLDTAQAFLDLIRDQAILEADHENEDVLRQKLTEVRVRAAHGDLTQTDVRQAEARLARANVDRFQSESAVTADQASYQRLVGHLPGALKSPEMALSQAKTLNDILQGSVNHPDVIAAEYAVDEARAEVRLNEGSLLPEVNLVGSSSRNWGQNSTIPGREDSSQVLLQATVPLYRSGADYSRSREAQQVVAQRQMELDEARHKAYETAQNAWQAFTAAQAAIAADKEGIDAAAQALEGVKVEAKVGTRTTLDVLNAQQELLDAQVDFAKSQHDKAFALVQIRAAIGILTADHLGLPVKLYDPSLHYKDVRQQWAGFSRDDARYMGDATRQAP